MKKLTLMFSLVLAFGLANVQAQSSSKADCSKECAKACTSASTASKADMKAAAKLAKKDDTIEKKVCEDSGTVSYVRMVKNDDGEASAVPVRYDSAKGQFVGMSAEGKAKCSTSSSCCKKTAAKDTKKAST